MTIYIQKITSFEQLFDKPGTHRLVIDVHPDKPLVYEVYCKDSLQITKEWTDDIMTGTFKLKLIEPEPVKRVLRYNAATQKNVAIKLSSEKCVNIFWGGTDTLTLTYMERNGQSRTNMPTRKHTSLS